MSKEVAVRKLLADLNDLARAVRPLHSQILNALLAEARKEIQKFVTKEDEQLTPMNDKKMSSSP
ncbi:MAG: hypothetical protein ABR878_04070 [Roseiarcus sp.]|jgi:hypothetical protein